MEVTNPKYPTMLWASLMSDNEVFISQFLCKRGWSYRSFAEILKTLHATAVFHVTVGKSKRKGEHYDATVKLILATAKDFWLYPCTSLRKELRESLARIAVDGKHPYGYLISKLVLHPGFYNGQAKLSDAEQQMQMVDTTPTPIRRGNKQKAHSAELLSLKKRLGGFYLLYTLYWKQPYQGLNHIIMDEKDLNAVKEFEADVKRLLPRELQDEYNFMMTKLKYYRAFDFHVFAEEHGIGYSIRNLMNAKYDSHIQILKLCKELQDELTHNLRIGAAQDNAMKYVSVKNTILNGVDLNADVKISTEHKPTLVLVAIDAEEETPMEVDPPGPTLLNILQNADNTLETIAEVAQSLKDMGDVPLITRSVLLGNETADRQLTNEAKKRRNRMEVKEKKGNPAQRYDRDIFGSRKLKQQSGPQKRGRSQTSMNLWAHYIPENYEFPKCPPPVCDTGKDNAQQQRGNTGGGPSTPKK